MLSIYAPDIEVGITDKSKINFACEVVKTIMGNIFYNEELRHDVITIHNDGIIVAEIMLRPNPNNGILKGFMIKNQWYCLPDAYDVISNVIAEQVESSNINTKFSHPMYNKGYDDGFSDAMNTGSSFTSIYENMDWELFLKQKQWIVDCVYSDVISGVTHYDREMAEGILHLMDTIGDAVEANGIKSKIEETV